MVAFSLLVRILGECSFIHSLPALLLLLFFKWRLVSVCMLIPLLKPGSVHSGLESWDDSPLRLCWVKGVCVIMCNLPPAFLAKWLGSFTCHCGNTGVERTPNTESARKVNSGEENPPRAPAAIWTPNFWITSLALYQQAIPAISITYSVGTSNLCSDSSAALFSLAQKWVFYIPGVQK